MYYRESGQRFSKVSVRRAARSVPAAHENLGSHVGAESQWHARGEFRLFPGNGPDRMALQYRAAWPGD